MNYRIFYREREKRLWGEGEYKAEGSNSTTKIGTPEHNIDPVLTINIIKDINGANALMPVANRMQHLDTQHFTVQARQEIAHQLNNKHCQVQLAVLYSTVVIN